MHRSWIHRRHVWTITVERRGAQRSSTWFEIGPIRGPGEDGIGMLIGPWAAEISRMRMGIRRDHAA